MICTAIYIYIYCMLYVYIYIYYVLYHINIYIYPTLWRVSGKFEYLLRLEPDGKNGREPQVLGVRFGQSDYPISGRTVPRKYTQYVNVCNI